MNEISHRTFETALRHFLGPLAALLDDDGITEIMVNGPREIWVERAGRLERRAEQLGDDELMALVTGIAQYVGRQIREEEPRFDARLPEGHRVHVVLPPLCRNGVSVTIRKHRKGSLSLDELVAKGSLTREAVDFLRGCIENHHNLIVSGGTGTGKTTLLNAFSSLIPPGERILVIEDSAELQIQQEHVVSLETRSADRKGRGAVSIRDLLHSALRMRPDRIVIGECRGGEAFDLLQAMNTGHAGSMSTLHANAPREALRRLETLALLGGVDIPHRFLRAQIAAAIHLVVQLQRLAGKRIVQSIAACEGLDEHESYRTVELFGWDVNAGELRRVGRQGVIPSCM